MPETDAIVNLAGDPIAGGRWTAARKAEIRRSRIEATRALVEAIAAAEPRPKVLVSASAVGYYGDRGDEPLDETPHAGQRLPGARLRRLGGRGAAGGGARRARRAAALRHRARAGRRRARRHAAAVSRRRSADGWASGRQWMSWVYRDDVVGLIRDALTSDAYAGPVNVTSPNPVTNADFTRALGRALVRRPSLLRCRASALRLLLGEMATMLLAGQRVLPAVAQRAGYAWRQPELPAALELCVGP